MSLVEVQHWPIAAVDSTCERWDWCEGPFPAREGHPALSCCRACATERLKARKAMAWSKQ